MFSQLFGQLRSITRLLCLWSSRKHLPAVCIGSCHNGPRPLSLSEVGSIRHRSCPDSHVVARAGESLGLRFCIPRSPSQTATELFVSRDLRSA